jgi:hypothetical protein
MQPSFDPAQSGYHRPDVVGVGAGAGAGLVGDGAAPPLAVHSFIIQL